jgi:hypothetical protein
MARTPWHVRESATRAVSSKGISRVPQIHRDWWEQQHQIWRRNAQRVDAVICSDQWVKPWELSTKLGISCQHRHRPWRASGLVLARKREQLECCSAVWIQNHKPSWIPCSFFYLRLVFWGFLGFSSLPAVSMNWNLIMPFLSQKEKVLKFSRVLNFSLFPYIYKTPKDIQNESFRFITNRLTSSCH